MKMKYCLFCMNPIEENDVECPFCGKKLDVELPSHHLKPGTILNKKIYVGAALGEGGFGITYIGRDLNLDIKVAVKEYYPNGYVNRSNTISPDLTCSISQDKKDFFDKGRERFLREARILAKFAREPGVVEVRDFFEENNTAYIIMEFLEGQDLKEYLKVNGTLSPEQTIRLLMPVMQALTKIHSQGLIHRDISPDNIRIIDGGVKLLDFGAARDVSAVANKSLSVMLKPGYAPEEQYRSKGNQGPWTDVYALCATMYKCITGITPDDSTQRLFSDELKSPSALGVIIDTTIEAALMKGLAVLQRDRYQTIDELLNGFKGINAVVSPDGKTVYSGAGSEELDKGPERATYNSVRGEDTVTQANPVVEKKNPVVVEREVKKEVSPVSNGTASENSDYQSNSSVDNAKKKSSRLPIFIMLGAILVAIIILIGVIAFGGGDDKPEDTGSKGESTTQTTESETNDTKSDIEMSDKLFDFTLEVEGTVFKLPCKYEDLTAAGWTISSSGYSDSTTIKGNSYDSFTMSNNGKKMTVSSYNMSGNTKAIKDCLVGGISWEAYNGVDIKMAKGITVTSTVDEIIAAFGTPNSRNDYDDYVSLTYQQNDSMYNEVRFMCYKSADEVKYSTVYVENFVASESDNTETNTEKPAYLAEYKKPIELGTDFKTGIVKIEGDLYQLPAPVSAFTDNGWKITEQPGSVKSGNSETIRVERNGVKMYLSVQNFADYQTTPENCAVYKFYVDATEGVDIELPNGISFESVKADVEAAVTDEFSYYKGTYNYSWTYSEYNSREFNFDIAVDVETNKVSRLTVSCKTWDY